VHNPYAHVDWASDLRVGSATHMHMTSQARLDNAYRHGIRHFPMSNYYPSAPYTARTRVSDFWLSQDWPARLENGDSLAPPINWNDVITWRDELDEPYRSQLPVEETEPLFPHVPDDAIISPNAEHHGFTNSTSHICSPGSAFTSGNIDPRRQYHLKDHGFCVGFGGAWQEAFEGMLEGLVYPGAGGITINHPTWFTRFSDEQVLEMLDFDEGVLGIEIYNDYSARRDWSLTAGYEPPDESAPGFSLNLWDRILSTGRRCWGSCVPDHSVGAEGNWRGRSILLMNEFTDRACLEAYRQGRFYGCLDGSGLSVVDFAATDASVSVSVNRAATIRFITEKGVSETAYGESAAHELPQLNGAPDLVFLRVEIDDDRGERLFLQPVMYRPRS